MICPFCGHNDDKVIDSRPTEAGKAIRRRRECLQCEKRYSTYERVEQAARLMVVKKDGTRVPFDVDKVLRGLNAAVGKRPVPEDARQAIARAVEDELHAEFEREVDSRVIGERVMIKLRETDLVSYLRFAIEHLQLSSLEEVNREVNLLRDRPPAGRDQPALFGAAAGPGT